MSIYSYTGKMIQLALEAKSLLVVAILRVVVRVIEMHYSSARIVWHRVTVVLPSQVLSNITTVRRVPDRSIIQLLTLESIKHQHART